LEQPLSIPPPFSFLSKVGFEIHLHTFTMLPHVPLIQFHDYSTLVAPQTFGLWFFPILVCALRFLPTTLGVMIKLMLQAQNHAIFFKDVSMAIMKLHSQHLFL
jgi:hypothetical protein